MTFDISAYYTQKLADTLLEKNKLKKKLTIASIGRLVFFLLTVFCLYQIFHQFQMQWLLLAILAIICFLGMISWFINIKIQENYQTQFHYFLQNELNQIKDIPNDFDNGLGFDDGEGFGSDLDIYGKGSLYHHINRTITAYGQKALANQFKNSFFHPTAILTQQEAIQIAAAQIEIIQSVIVTSLVNKTSFVSFDSIFNWLQTDNKFLNSNWLKTIRYIMPIVNSVFVFLAIFKGYNSLLGIVFVLGWIQIGAYAKYLQTDFNLLSKKENILKQYAQVLQKFEKIDPKNSVLLQSYKLSAQQAHIAIEELSRISSRIDQRLNIFLITIFNPIFLYDIQNMFALEAWKIKYKEQLVQWIELVGEIEKLNSFAVYSFNNPEYIFPVPLESKMGISATDLSHPLISKDKRIPNDIHFTELNKVLLITGSNMSGKTTFLRTIGINMVLAQSGLPVPATNFLFSPMQLFSSIRISDSLQESTSYFMAELKKLSSIKKEVSNHKASMVLIDEILRGTNSEDKYFGSAQFVKEMLALNCITIFATHDLKLSELEQKYPDVVLNYCFESTIDNNELFFNYKIQRGVAKNRNASFLMKKMGII